MSEEETESVEEASSQATESETQAEATESEQKAPSEAERNWAETRRKMQELERQNRALYDKVESYEKRNSPKQEEDELDTLSDDDIVTASQARKMAEKLARKVAEDVVKQREASTSEERLSLKHPDFAQVVTRENIELLKQTEPELAQSLYHIPDPYQQGVAAYKLLKKLGLGENRAAVDKDKAKAQANASKPVSVNAATKSSAIGNAHLFENGLTPDLKKQLWGEMQQAMKGA